MSAFASSPPRRRRALVLSFYVLTLVGTLVLIGSTFLAPWLASRNSSLAAPFYRAFSSVCHQIPSRCLSLFGQPLAVCGRCLGVYVGLLGGCLAFPLRAGLFSARLPRPWVFPVFTLPLAVDLLGNALTLWSTGIWLRMITGFLWGIILPFFFLAALNDLAVRGLAIHRPPK